MWSMKEQKNDHLLHIQAEVNMVRMDKFIICLCADGDHILWKEHRTSHNSASDAKAVQISIEVIKEKQH